MNDIDKMPPKCRDCPYWELAKFPWCCGDCKDRMKNPVSDFVSRQWLIDEYHRRHEGPPGGALKMIEDAPAADVAPVKHGRWIDRGSLSCRCSACGCKSGTESKYCLNCGAKNKEG